MADKLKTLRGMTVEEQKAIMGDDYETLKAFLDKADVKKKQEQAKNFAEAMISGPTEDDPDIKAGKYFGEYSKLQVQLDRINGQMDGVWKKALNEANIQVGIVPATEE